MTASERRSSRPMTSVIRRHSSWVSSLTLERAYRKPFLTVFGESEPQNVVGHRVDPKKALTSQRVFWAIVRHNPSTDDFSRRAREKNKKEEALYFTYFARRSLTADWHKFLVTCSSRGRNQYYCAQFYRNRLRGLDSVRGRSLTIPIGLRYRR